MKIAANTPKEYFDALTDERRKSLLELRGLIKKLWPGIVEDLSYGMPTYHLEGHTLCSIANQKHYMAMYIMPYDLLDAFNKQLKGHDTGRSCIRFRRLEEPTMELFKNIILYTGSKYPDSKFYGKAVHEPAADKITEKA